MIRRLHDLLGQERARANARGAAVELTRRHLERTEVELFVARCAARARRSA